MISCLTITQASSFVFNFVSHSILWPWLFFWWIAFVLLREDVHVNHVLAWCKLLRLSVEVNRYGFFGVDTGISAIHGPITDISKIFKSCFLLHYQKCNVFYVLPFFQKLKNQNLWQWILTFFTYLTLLSNKITRFTSVHSMLLIFWKCEINKLLQFRKVILNLFSTTPLFSNFPLFHAPRL